MIVMAITDEATGDILRKPRTLASFSLHEVGGPPINEKPDATGLFSDGRFLDFSNSKNLAGRGGNFHPVAALLLAAWLGGSAGACARKPIQAAPSATHAPNKIAALLLERKVTFGTSISLRLLIDLSVGTGRRASPP